MSETNGNAPVAEREEFESFFEGIGDEGKTVSVFRRRIEDGKLEFCGPLPVQGFGAEVVQRHFGGGDYDLRAYGPGTKKNPSGYLGRVGLSIAGPPKSQDPDAGDVSELARARKEVEDLRATVDELKGMRVEDRVAALTLELRNFMNEVRNPPKQADNADPFRMALELADHFRQRAEPHLEAGPPAMDPAKLFDTIMGAFTKGMELGQMGASPGEGGYMEVIRQLGGPALRLLERAVSVTGAAGPSGALPPGTQPPEVGTVPATLKDVIGSWVPTLLEWARANADPELRADFVCDELPDTWLDELQALLMREGAGTSTMLLGWYPELMPVRPWLDRFIARISDNLTSLPGSPGQDEDDGVELGTRPK